MKNAKKITLNNPLDAYTEGLYPKKVNPLK